MKKLLLLLIFLFIHCTSFAQQQPFTFVVIGDDRVNLPDAHGDTTVNVNNFKRILNDIAAMNPLPDYLFVNGDLVYGHTKDTARLDSELSVWKGIYNASPLGHSHVKLVTIPGNHEVCTGGLKQTSLLKDEQAFVREMKDDLPFYGDTTITNQSRLYYSFDYKGNHFVLLNTDPAGAESAEQLQWLKNDLATTEAITNTQHIFVFGHKPLYLPAALNLENEKPDSYLDSIWQLLNQYKCDIYFASHVHMYDSYGNTSITEVICGNVGADTYPPDKGGWQNPYYGYCVLKVSHDTISVKSFGYNIDEKNYTGYYNPATDSTTLRTWMDLTK